MIKDRKPRSIRLTEVGLSQAKKFLSSKRHDSGSKWNFDDLAFAAGISKKTVERFFKGIPVDEMTAIAIAEALDRKLTDFDFVHPSERKSRKENSGEEQTTVSVRQTNDEFQERRNEQLNHQTKTAHTTMSKTVMIAINQGEKLDAFVQPTFEDYSAALPLNDWQFFLKHIPENLAQGTYLVFEPQWKKILFMWLREQKVPAEQKEALLQALVLFDDNCDGFYDYQAFFLSAECVKEFRQSTWADFIVEQLIRWSFGDFDEEMQKWTTYLDYLEQGAREALLKSDPDRVIPALNNLLSKIDQLLNREEIKHKWRIESIRREVAVCLAEIQTVNQQANPTPVGLLNTSQDESTSALVAENLITVDPNDLDAATCAKLLLDTSLNYFTRQAVADRLIKIGVGDLQVITEMLLLRSQMDEVDKSARQAVAESLQTLGTDEQKAIVRLAIAMNYMLWQLTSLDDSTRRTFAESLGEIVTNYPGAIALVVSDLIKKLQSTPNQDIRRATAESLGIIVNCYQKASFTEVIDILNQLITTTQSDSIRYLATESLKLIGRRHCKATSLATDALVEIIETAQDDNRYDDEIYDYNDIRVKATESLGRIGKASPQVINALLNVLDKANSNPNFYRFPCENEINFSLEAVNAKASEDLRVALIQELQGYNSHLRTWLLMSIASEDNLQSIDALVGQLGNDNEELDSYIALKLGDIGKGNKQVMYALIKLLNGDEDWEWEVQKAAAKSLKKILTSDLLPSAITALKNWLSDQVYTNDLDCYSYCYDIIWQCAKNMSYPDFYEAWYSQPTTPKKRDFNLSNLPHLIDDAIANNSQLADYVKIICIDGSKFIDPDNPAAKIYTEMVKNGCSKSDDCSIPKTMLELQAYWDLLTIDSDKHIVLVLFGEQELSYTFLDTLSKFDGAICVVTGDLVYDLTLRQFSASQPQVVENMVNWIHRRLRWNLHQ